MMTKAIKIRGSKAASRRPATGAADVGRPQGQPDLSRYRGRVGDAVRKRREKLRLTPEELSQRLAGYGVEIGARAIYAYEQGTRPISLDDLPAFAKALETTTRRLIPDEG